MTEGSPLIITIIPPALFSPGGFARRRQGILLENVNLGPEARWRFMKIILAVFAQRARKWGITLEPPPQYRPMGDKYKNKELHD